MIMANMGLPSFFKVLVVPDFMSMLRIPPLFGETFEHMLHERALLRTKSGETWSVKIEQIGERYCFTDGWPKFVKDLELKMGEFLVFWLMPWGKTIFRVATYGTTGCEKDLNPATTIYDQSKMIDKPNLETTRKRGIELSKGTTDGSRRKAKKIENEKRGHGAKISDDSADDQKCFIRVLKKYHRYRMHVPMGFAKKTGIIHKSEVMLQNLNGVSWRVELQLHQNSMLFMCKGWQDFRKSNKLMLGSKYAFEFIPETESIRLQRLSGQH